MGEETGGLVPPIEKICENEMKDINSFDLTNKYSFKDKGPYSVYVEHLNKNIGRLFPMKVGFYFLEEKDFKNDILDIVSVGVNRVKILFKTFSIANNLIQHNIIIKNNLVAYIPTFYNHRKGVIRMVDTSFSEDFLKQHIQCDNSKIINVQRMKRKVNDTDGNKILVDRQMIIVTFAGNTLPDKVRINLSYFTVDPYIHPVVQCFTCLKYGHTAKLCKSKTKRCITCANIHNTENPCSDCSSFCIYCQTKDHKTISKNCPTYSQQYNIKKEMATRNISFKDAEQIVKNPSYAKVATHNRFSILNNMSNFPPLAEPPSLQNPPKVFIRKPVQPSTSDRKRKQRSPSSSPPIVSKKHQISEESKCVLPNPYRDEFIQYKEKLICGITDFIDKYFVNKINENSSTNTSNHSSIRNFISSLMEVETDHMSEAISISDNDSTY